MSVENSKYSKLEYWNERYSSEEEYEWLGDYKSIRYINFSFFLNSLNNLSILNFSIFSPFMEELIPTKNVQILMLGCGNSNFSADMYEDGYHNIVNSDISEVCIKKMAELHADKTMRWIVEDATSLKSIQVILFVSN